MKAFVTGTTGLIGNHLLHALIREGYTVKALLRKTSDPAAVSLAGVELVYGDILDLESLKAAAAGCDIIFHAAGVFAYWGYDAAQFTSDATKGMENIIATAAHCSIRRIVFTSSTVTMGATEKKLVLSESKPGNFDDAPAYITAKVQQEHTAFALAGRYGVEVVAICPGLTIGQQHHHRLTESNQMIVNYIKNPFKSTWIGGCNIIGAPDVAAAMLILAEKGVAGEKYIAAGDNMEWQDLHAIISGLCGLPGPFAKAMHTASYLASAVHELWYALSKEWPSSTRAQAKMVGKYYWYDSSKLKALGYAPSSSEAALVATLSWLIASEHVPGSVRASMRPDPKINDYRKQHETV